ncbi:MAG: DUF5683 domain-containing protein [Mangrovibacterium sp.]
MQANKRFLCPPLILILILLLQGVYGQESEAAGLNRQPADSLQEKSTEPVDTIKQKPEIKEHSAHKATLLSLIPGAGQIYNKKYWKLPLVYGGFGALFYAISWNHGYYKDYKEAYIDISDDDPETTAYLDLDIEGVWDFDDPSQVQLFTTRLKKAKNSARRYRDLCIIGSVAFYALTIIDATVDAHLFGFDISDDLTMSWIPQPAYAMDKPVMGIHCVINF